MKSIISNEKYCYICGNPQVEKHHIFAGCYRDKSEKEGAWVYLCPYHHRLQGGTGSHNPVPSLDKKLKQLAQKKIEETKGHEYFMKVFNRNYLE